MPKTLVFSIITITLALVFYTIGVFSEHKAKTLKKWHVVIFWFGLLFDTLGTTAMSQISKSTQNTISASNINIHGLTGALAIILMLFHALWASWVVYKGSDKSKVTFHKFSLLVWLIWLIPYFIGAFIGMKH